MAATALLDSLASDHHQQQHHLSPIEKLAARSSSTSTSMQAAAAPGTPEDAEEIQRTIQEVRRYMRAFRED